MELDSYLKQTPNVELAKRLKVLVWIVSALVLGLVATMRPIRPWFLSLLEKPEGLVLPFLPPFHAALNAFAAFGLVMAVRAIKKRRVSLHRKWIFLALACSSLFLISYVCYHLTTFETAFGGQGWISKVYYFVLISHIVLAALSFPFILLTFVYGYTNHFFEHRKLARIVYPVWLYVAVTGPVVYLMLRPYY
jgi:putative membrane protein